MRPTGSLYFLCDNKGTFRHKHILLDTISFFLVRSQPLSWTKLSSENGWKRNCLTSITTIIFLWSLSQQRILIILFHTLSLLLKPNLRAPSRTGKFTVLWKLRSSSRIGRLTVLWKFYVFLDRTLNKQVGLTVVDLDTLLDWSNVVEFPSDLLTISR